MSDKDLVHIGGGQMGYGGGEHNVSATSSNELLCAIDIVLRDQLDRVDVHPCDENNDEVKAKGLSEELKHLYKARNLFSHISEAQQIMKAKVAEQAEDEGIWFIAETAAEYYLQCKLRELHEIIEQECNT